MARRLTEAAALKQLKTVGDKLAGKVTGKQRLELLRRQAELGDQRDAAVDRTRQGDAAQASDDARRDRRGG
jgi:hypothetical protein